MKRLAEKPISIALVQPEMQSRTGKGKPPRKKSKVITDESETVHTKEVLVREIDRLVRLEVWLLEKEAGFHDKLFLKAGPGKRSIGDPHRRQMSFTKAMKLATEDIRTVLVDLKTSVETVMKKNYPSYHLSEGAILMSLNGGVTQAWHRDYPLNQFAHAPMVFFTPISSSSRLDVFHTSLFESGFDEVELPTTKKGFKLRTQVCVAHGELLTLNGYAVHRGCAYQKTNFRLHFYALHDLDKKYLNEVGDWTQIVDVSL